MFNVPAGLSCHAVHVSGEYIVRDWWKTGRRKPPHVPNCDKPAGRPILTFERLVTLLEQAAMAQQASSAKNKLKQKGWRASTVRFGV